MAIEEKNNEQENENRNSQLVEDDFPEGSFLNHILFILLILLFNRF
jgi:hypothetical protein